MACLKKHLQITQKGGIYIDNMGWILNIDSQFVHWSSLSDGNLVNVVNSCNRYHHRVTILTRGTEISLPDIVSSGYIL